MTDAPTLPGGGPGQRSLRIGLFSNATADLVHEVRATLERGGHTLAVVVISRFAGIGRPRSRLVVRRAAELDPAIPVLVTDRLEPVAAPLAAFDLDLILLQLFPRRVPPAILALPRLGCVNIHPSSLPRYRGPDPVGWQLYHGEATLGITCHRLDASFDTGPILLQTWLPIRPEDNRQSLRRAINAEVIRLLPELLGLIAAGVPGTPQDEAGATYAPLFTDRERTLDWTRSARALVNQIRAVGETGAVARLDGREYRVSRAEVAAADATGAGLPPAHRTSEPPGTVLAEAADGIVVATGDGLLRITELRAP